MTNDNHRNPKSTPFYPSPSSIGTHLSSRPHRVSLLILEALNLPLQLGDLLLRSFNGSATVVSALLLMLPSADTVLLLLNSAFLGVNLCAHLALLALGNGRHHEFHPTGLSSAVLLGAVLTEVSPLEVAALHLVLVVKAHVGQTCCQNSISPGLAWSHLKHFSTWTWRLTGCGWGWCLSGRVQRWYGDRSVREDVMFECKLLKCFMFECMRGSDECLDEMIEC